MNTDLVKVNKIFKKVIRINVYLLKAETFYTSEKILHSFIKF